MACRHCRNRPTGHSSASRGTPGVGTPTLSRVATLRCASRSVNEGREGAASTTPTRRAKATPAPAAAAARTRKRSARKRADTTTPDQHLRPRRCHRQARPPLVLPRHLCRPPGRRLARSMSMRRIAHGPTHKPTACSTAGGSSLCIRRSKWTPCVRQSLRRGGPTMCGLVAATLQVKACGRGLKAFSSQMARRLSMAHTSAGAQSPIGCERQRTPLGLILMCTPCVDVAPCAGSPGYLTI